MTACVNKNHGRRVAGVVTASLVGALTLGGVSLAAVPTVALAEQGSLQAADWTTGAKVTRATDGKGAAVSDPANASFSNTSGKYLVPVEVTNSFGDATVVTEGYTFTYTVPELKSQAGTFTTGTFYKADGTQVNVTTANTLSQDGVEALVSGKLYSSTNKNKSTLVQVPTGTYKVTVTNNKTGESTQPFSFKVTQKSLEGAYVYEQKFEKKADGSPDYTKPTDDTSDKSFQYDGTEKHLGVAYSDGEVASTSVTVTDTKGNSATAEDAGTYVASVTVNGQTKGVRFTVDKLDLSKAALSVDDIEVNGSAALKVNGEVANDKVFSNIDYAVTAPDGTSSTGSYSKSGVYTFDYSAKDNQDNVTGSGSASFTVYDEAAQVNYGSKPLTDREFVLSDGESFDAAKLNATYGDDTYEGDALEVTYVDTETGEKVDASALANDGVYKVTVRVKPFQNSDDEWVGGSVTAEITVTGKTLAADKTVAFYKDGKISDSVSTTYDGSDVLKAITVVVKDKSGNTLKEGTDYTLEAKNADTKKVVDSIVDSGDYTVTVKPVTFKFDDADKAVLPVQVKKVDLSTLVADVTDTKMPALDNGQLTLSGQEYYVAYTGSAVDLPGVKYETVRGGKYTYTSLDKSLYNVVSVSKGGSVVKEAKDEGAYIVKIALTDEGAKNYDLGSTTGFQVNVKKYGYFEDVAPEAWYAKGVERAYHKKYVNGIAGTKLFSPLANITRADAAIVLFNMAGGSEVHQDPEFSFTEDGGYVTGFSDVDGHAYYAKAIAWAKAAGVATGDSGTTNFRPTDTISRQEFAALLVKYAKSTGKYVAPTTDELSKLSDAGTVDGWARDAVNWAVVNKVMGNGGYVAGQDNITRAEVASMAVNYQPNVVKGVTERP